MMMMIMKIMMMKIDSRTLKSLDNLYMEKYPQHFVDPAENVCNG